MTGWLRCSKSSRSCRTRSTQSTPGNSIAPHILAFEGDSHVEWFEGNYQEYEKDRRRRMGADADQPHRIKYRRIDA
jgi:hypothetical protein